MEREVYAEHAGHDVRACMHARATHELRGGFSGCCQCVLCCLQDQLRPASRVSHRSHQVHSRLARLARLARQPPAACLRAISHESLMHVLQGVQGLDQMVGCAGGEGHVACRQPQHVVLTCCKVCANPGLRGMVGNIRCVLSS